MIWLITGIVGAGADEEGTLDRIKALRRELVDAVRCAVAVQLAMPERNTGFGADSRIQLRIGINLGDVIVEGDDIRRRRQRCGPDRGPGRCRRGVRVNTSPPSTRVEWFERSAMADLLGEDLGLAEIHKLYRCRDRLLEHKQALFDHLVGRWRDLFNISFRSPGDASTERSGPQG
jgi:hypothetical protein